MLIWRCLPLHTAACNAFRHGMHALMPTSRYCCMTGSSLNRLPCTPAKLLVFWTASTLTCIMRCAKRQVDNVSATCSACTHGQARDLISCGCRKSLQPMWECPCFNCYLGMSSPSAAVLMWAKAQAPIQRRHAICTA